MMTRTVHLCLHVLRSGWRCTSIPSGRSSMVVAVSERESGLLANMRHMTDLIIKVLNMRGKITCHNMVLIPKLLVSSSVSANCGGGDGVWSRLVEGL